MTTHRDASVLHHVEHVMGTTVSFDIREPAPAVGALDDVVRWLHHVDATFSTYRDDSEITRFGRGELSLDELGRDTQDILLRCIELTDLTGGAFDVFAVPAPNGTMLDPSGLVKGWSIERAAAMLEAAGAMNFCINAGGDIVVRGEAAPDRGSGGSGFVIRTTPSNSHSYSTCAVRSASQHLRHMSAARTSSTPASAHRPPRSPARPSSDLISAWPTHTRQLPSSWASTRSTGSRHSPATTPTSSPTTARHTGAAGSRTRRGSPCSCGP